jgi:transcriptional regulator with XRE-family HTH domain
MTFGDRLREARKLRGLTLQELAKKTGISYSSISLYENDGRDPSFFNLFCIAEVLNVSLDWLAGRTTNMEVSND